MPLEPGTKIGEYTLVRRLDQGNMGELWVAQRGKLEAAIKFVLNAQPHLIERFQREIEILSQLSSSYIVAIKDWGTFEGSPYMIMDLLHGSNLASMLQGGRRIEPLTLAIDYVVQAAAGLSQAHGKKIIHRDLKPANLFFDKTARHLKVLDFGVAGAASAGEQPLTQAGMYIGTPSYSAPEQFVDTRKVTAAADIWALGVILYELLTGTMAFPGGPAGLVALMRTVTEEEPPPLEQLRPDVPPGVLSAVRRCLRKKPAERFASADDLIEALAPFGSEAARAIRALVQSRQEQVADTVPDQRVDPPAPPPGPPPAKVPSPAPPGRTANTDSPDWPPFFSQVDLVNAVSAPRTAPNSEDRRPVVFMLGAGFSLPSGKHKGVPGTKEIVRRIKDMLPATQHREFDDRLQGSSNEYQDAFDYLSGSHGNQDSANEVIRRAVLDAYRGKPELPKAADGQQEACKRFEEDTEKWDMPAGVSVLGRIIATGLKDKSVRHFSGRHLTTNFDPLLAVAIARQGGLPVPLAVGSDFPIPPSVNNHCKIIHLHGRWNEGDTLHNRLNAPRPLLEGSLEKLLHESVLVVLGYGGWTDVFMEVLRGVAKRQAVKLDILWAFYDDRTMVMARQGDFVRKLAERCGSRITFYQRVDTNDFFHQLADRVLPDTIPPPSDRARRKPTAAFIATAGALGLAVGAAYLREPVTVPPQPEVPDSGTLPQDKPLAAAGEGGADTSSAGSGGSGAEINVSQGGTLGVTGGRNAGAAGKSAGGRSNGLNGGNHTASGGVTGTAGTTTIIVDPAAEAAAKKTKCLAACDAVPENDSKQCNGLPSYKLGCIAERNRAMKVCKAQCG